VKNLIAFLEKVRIRQILTVFLAGVLLVISTACNSGDVTGARPENPPVQMGGNNNPHKSGGDGYTNYKASTDSKAVRGNRADLQLVAPQLIAASNVGDIQSNRDDVLYPSANAGSTNRPAIGTRAQKELQEQVKQFPKERQPVIDRSDPGEKILERVGEQFKDASGFLKETGDSALQKPELAPNPAERRY
jgi:hypothetical protein